MFYLNWAGSIQLFYLNIVSMKYRIFLLAAILMISISWLRNDHEVLPSPPSNYSIIGKTVQLKFKVNKKSMNGVEFALNQGQGPNNFFLHFDLSADWAKGNFGLILKDMSEKSMLKSSSGLEADIERFEKDNKGRKINYYQFDQTLVEDESGVFYMKMSYTGSSMPLIESLRIEKDLTLPRHISARFVNKSNLIFKAGTYGLDSEINGFWIPVDQR
jgi:hypothetical protein